MKTQEEMFFSSTKQMEKIMRKHIMILNLFMCMLCANVQVSLGQVATDEIPGDQELKNILSNLTAKMKESQTRFGEYAEKNYTAYISDVDEIIAELDTTIHELSEEGELYKNIENALKQTDNSIKEAERRALDPNLTPEVRSRYRAIARELEDGKGRIINNRDTLLESRRMLAGRRENLNQEKELVAFMIQVGNLEALATSLDNVMGLIMDTIQSIDNLGPQTYEDSGETGPQ